MGFFTETLRLIVDADTKGAVSGVEKFGDTSVKEAERSEKALSKWGGRLTGLGAGMIGFGVAALAGMGKAAMAAEEAHLATVKLENTIRNMPKLAGASSAEFIDLAESIQDVTAADADAIVEGQALLGTFSLTAKEIKGITPLVVDYARKFGMDIPDAAIQVGKALDGQIGALKRNGVSIDEVLFKTNRYMAVQQALEDQVGGFAEDEGKTFAGSLQRLKNQMGDLVEGIGVGAVEAFTDLADRADFVTDAFKDLDPATQSLIGKIVTYGGVAAIAAGATGVVAGQAISLFENLTSAASGMSNLVGKLGGLKNVLIGAGVAAAIAVISVELAKLDDQAAKAKFMDRFGDLDRLVANLGRTSSTAKAQVEEVIGLITTGFLDADEVIQRLADVSTDSAEAFIKAAQAAGVEDDVISEMRQTLKDHETAAEEATSGQAGLNEEMDEGASTADAATEALKEYENQLNAMFDPVFGMMDAQRGVAEAQADATAKLDALNEAIKEHGGDSVEAAEAQREFEAAQQAAAEAALAEDIALQQLTTALLTGDLTTGEFTAKLAGLVAQGRLTQEQADFLTGSLAGLTQQAIAAGDTDPIVDVSLSGDDDVRRRLIELLHAADSIPQKIHIGVTGYGAIPGRAVGGPVKEGEAYWVGENRRPELFVPNTDGHIFTQDDVYGGGMGGGGWGGGPTELVLRYEPSGDRLVDAMFEGLRVKVQKRGGDVQRAMGWRR